MNLAAAPVRQRKLLVANRSEIAIRVFRAATELGLRTVAIYAQEDRLAIHRFKADEAYVVGEGKGPVGAYLDIPSIIALAKEKGVDFIHPGYGFLSENADFAKACEEAGIIFVGPRVDLLRNMGDKTAARALAQKVNVPVLPGTEDPIEDRGEALKVAKQIGFPLIIKAAFRRRRSRHARGSNKPGDLADLLAEAQGEAGRAFGNPAVFLERYIPRAKHIEVQILGDKHGKVVHLHERDCSVQRRHQKVIEIAPSVELDRTVRAELCDAAVKLCREIKYDNAGTVEFLYDPGHEGMVLHRDEPAHPGGAHGHGGHHRPGPRALADSDRRRRSRCTVPKSAFRRRKTFRATATPCNAASRRRIRKTSSSQITAVF
jgi:pyruvate carboxylase